MAPILLMISTIFLNAFAGCICQRIYYDSIGPQNITRRSGENNVYIPCSIPGIYFPMWRINDVYYEAFSLPEELIPASYGLLIPTVGIEMDGWKFQCLASTGYRHDLHISTVGVLTVENQTAPVLSIPRVQVTRFDLNHQQLVFETRYKFLAWRSENASCNLFQMTSSTCAGTILHEWPEGSIQGMQVNVTSKNISNQKCLNFFKINAVNEQNGPVCQEMKQNFQIKESDLTKNKQVPFNGFCEPITTPRGSFPYIVLPEKNSSNADCICGYALIGNCSTPKECSCGNDTLFNESLHVCSLGMNNETFYAVCFYNLTREMNNTYVHIYESIKECHECSGPMQSVRFNVPYRIYFEAFKIVIVLPNEPTINVTRETGKICFQSVNPDGILLTNFNILILDATKLTIFNQTCDANNNSIFCISVGDLLQNPICSPFNITVEAHNQLGKTVSYNVTETFNNSDVCTCISRNVMISQPLIQDMNGDSGIRVTINCSTTYFNVANLRFWLVVSMGTEDHLLSTNITSCSKNQSAHIGGLTCDQNYNISVFWHPSNENQYHLHPCALHRNITYTHKKCSTTENGLSTGGVIGIAISVIICVLALLCIATMFCKFIEKKIHCQAIPNNVNYMENNHT